MYVLILSFIELPAEAAEQIYTGAVSFLNIPLKTFLDWTYVEK